MRAAPLGHMAWGPAEAEFALEVWRAELELRPVLTATWRALRSLEEPSGDGLADALRGAGRHPRSPECCARLLTVFGELGLIEYVASARGGPACRLVGSARADLERSATYRRSRELLSAIERALPDELAVGRRENPAQVAGVPRAKLPA